LKFFVTGGAGFVGSAFVREALSAGHSVTVFDNFSRGKRQFLPSDARLEIVEGDIRDRVRVREAIANDRPDVVTHLAALHFIPDCIRKPQETLQINVDGTGNVLFGCAGAGVKRIIFASTAAVYAPSTTACSERSTPLDPAEVYGQSKILGELLVRGHHDRTRAATSIMRLFNAIGPRETNPHVIPHIFESLRSSDVIPLGNIDTRRDYINVKDIATAILAMAKRPRGIAAYNVGTGTTHSVREMIDLLKSKLGRPLRAEVDQARVRPVDRPVLLADTTKFRSETSWTAQVSMGESIDELVTYYGLR